MRSIQRYQERLSMLSMNWIISLIIVAFLTLWRVITRVRRASGPKFFHIWAQLGERNRFVYKLFVNSFVPETTYIPAFASAFHPSPFRIPNQDPIQSNALQQTASAPYVQSQASPSPSSLQQMPTHQYYQQRHLTISDRSQSIGNRSEPISFWRTLINRNLYYFCRWEWETLDIETVVPPHCFIKRKY